MLLLFFFCLFCCCGGFWFGVFGGFFCEVGMGLFAGAYF